MGCHIVIHINTLITSNISDFGNIEGLQIVNPHHI
jgi:hypothetical protein